MKLNTAIFKEYDIRGKYPAEIDEKTAYALGRAFAKVSKVKKIVLGRDAREESEKVFWGLLAGLIDGGMKVDDLGKCSTPELFFAVGMKKYESGCMVTASHSPVGQTGFKFCDGKGRVFGKATGLLKLEKSAQQIAAKMKYDPKKNRADEVDFITIAKEYKDFALSFIRPADVRGLNLVLDASGGSGAHLADVVFNNLPLDVAFINFLPNDKTKGHGPNPLLSENQKAIKAEIKKRRSDLGVIFDGDADRAIFFEAHGELVEPYYINCLLSQIMLQIKPKMTVAVDARLSLAIVKAIKDAKGKVLTHRSGYANFIKTLSEKKLLFGCENSGHFMFNFALKSRRQFVYGDAIIPILLIMKYLRQTKQTLDDAIAPFKKSFVISGELNFKTGRIKEITAAIKKQFKGNDFSTIDGLSVTDKNGKWFFNVRPSHTEPLIRLNIEAADQLLLDELKHEIMSIIA